MKNYRFEFTLTEELLLTDFLYFNFPKEYFEREGNLLKVKIEGYKVLIFRNSNQIYLIPNEIKFGKQEIFIENLINPAYSQNFPIQIIAE